MKHLRLFLLTALAVIMACTRTGVPGETDSGNVITLRENGDVSQKNGSFEDYIGHGKYTLVFFWASWCFHCKDQAPNVTAVYEKYTDKGLVVLGVATDKELETVVAAMKEMDIHFPQIHDPSHELVNKYEILGYPSIFLFGPDGSIIAKNLHGDGIEEAVKKVL